jgi:hypothetical protein
MRSVLAPVVAALLLSGCVPAEGPMMKPGADCLACHDGGTARRWTVAGTWGGQGNHVAIQDANGKSLGLTTNDAGNFYTAESLVFPLQVSVNGTPMPGGLSASQGGSCNRCHAGGAAATGPLMLPGQDCITCHDGSAAKRFTVAGTWLPQGATVVLTDANGTTITLTTNQVGNFYTDAALAFPLTVRVNAETMPAAVTYGGCNRCHGSGGGGD